MGLFSLSTYENHKGLYHLVMWAALAAYIVCGQCQSCRLTKRLAVAEAKYQAQVAETAALQAQSDLIIAAKTHEAEVAMATADTKSQENAVLKEKVKAQATVIADLQAAEPPTTPEVEALPIVINLRAQVRALTQGFTLAQQTIANQDLEIKHLRLVIVDKDIIIAEWEAKFNREQALRLSCQDLSAMYKRELTKFRLTGTVKTVVIGGLAAGLAYSFLR